MNIDEIKMNAPDGATHYFQNSFGLVYFRKSNTTWWVWIESEKYWSQQKFKIEWRLKFKSL